MDAMNRKQQDFNSSRSSRPISILITNEQNQEIYTNTCGAIDRTVMWWWVDGWSSVVVDLYWPSTQFNYITNQKMDFQLFRRENCLFFNCYYYHYLRHRSFVTAATPVSMGRLFSLSVLLHPNHSIYLYFVFIFRFKNFTSFSTLVISY